MTRPSVILPPLSLTLLSTIGPTIGPTIDTRTLECNTILSPHALPCRHASLPLRYSRSVCLAYAWRMLGSLACSLLVISRLLPNA